MMEFGDLLYGKAKTDTLYKDSANKNDLLKSFEIIINDAQREMQNRNFDVEKAYIVGVKKYNIRANNKLSNKTIKNPDQESTLLYKLL